MKVYRNIFFNKEKILHGTGTEDILYTGKIYEFSTTLSNFFSLFDKDKDLVISCNSCKAKQFRNILRYSNGEIESTKENNIKNLPKTKSKINIGKKNINFSIKNIKDIVSNNKKICRNC